MSGYIPKRLGNISSNRLALSVIQLRKVGLTTR